MKVKLTPTDSKIKKIMVVSTILFVFVFSAYMIDLDLVRFVERLGNVGPVLRMFANFNPGILPEAIGEMLVSLALATAALFVGFWISVALAFLAASNTSPNRICMSSRLL